MAQITKQDINPYFLAGIMTGADWKQLAVISIKKKLKRGETGFSPVQMKNFTVNGHNCSPETREVILGYFDKKLEALRKVVNSI